MQVNGSGDIITEKKFDGHFKLHVEFRVPYEAAGKGQDRGNSGVYVQGRYEVQILDSYGLKPEKNDCGAIYGVAAPKENACRVSIPGAVVVARSAPRRTSTVTVALPPFWLKVHLLGRELPVARSLFPPGVRTQ